MVWRRKKVWFRRGISVLLGTGLILYGYGGSSCLAARSIDELWEVDEGSGEVELPEPGAYFGVETTFDDLGDMKCLSCILSDAMPDAGEKYAELLTEKPYEFELINTAEKSDGDKEVKLFYLNYTGSEEIEPLAWDADDVGIHLSIRQTISRDETEVRVLYPSEGVTPVGGEESNETDEETSSASELVKLPDPGAYFGVETEVYENQKNGLSSISFRLPGDYPNTGIDFAGLMEEEPFEFKLVGVDSMTEGDELTKFFQLAYTGSDKEFRVAKYISETNDGEKYHVQISQTTGTGDETILFMDYPTIGTELMEVELWDGAEDYTGDAEEVSDNEDWYYIEEEAENSESDTKAKSYKEIRDRYRPGGEKTDTSSETTSPETPKYAGVKSYAEIRDKMRAQLAEREKIPHLQKLTVRQYQIFRRFVITVWKNTV